MYQNEQSLRIQHQVVNIINISKLDQFNLIWTNEKMSSEFQNNVNL